MRSHHRVSRYRRTERLALFGLRCALAVVLATLGSGLGFAPRMAEGLGCLSLDPGLVRALGASGLAGGIALLVPQLAAGAALILGLSIAGATVSLPEAGGTAAPGGLAVMALMALALLLLGAALRLRHRSDAAAWHEMLARYADREERLRFRGA